MTKKSTSFIKGAAILMVAGVIIKIIGAFFRIPLGLILHSDGTSYYQSAYPFYVSLLVLSTAGFPAAIAKLVSARVAVNDDDGAYHIFQIAFRLMFAIGLTGMAIMLLGSQFLSRIIGNPEAVYSFQALSLALFFASMMSAYRGYFQGLQEMMPYAISQTVEQLGRVVVGLSLAYVLLGAGKPIAAAGATFGATFGAIVGTLYLWRRFKRQTRRLKTSGSSKKLLEMAIVKDILKLAIPITIGASVVPLLGLADAAIVMNRLLTIGYGEQAKNMYAYLSFYAASINNLPQVVLTSIQLSLLPAVSAYVASGLKDKLNETISAGIKVSVIIGAPSAVGLFVLAEPVIRLLYPGQEDVILYAPGVLQIISIGLIFLSVFQSTTGILQGLQQQMKPALNLLIGAVVKVVLCYMLVVIPSINIKGAAISTVVAYAIAAFLNVRTLKHSVYTGPSVIALIIKPVLAAFLMGILVWMIQTYGVVIMPYKLATVFAVAVGFFAYLAILFGLKTFTEADMNLMPGKKLIRKLQRG